MKWLFLALLTTCCHADIAEHFKKGLEGKRDACPIKNIDLIYLINLDQRPEKFEKSLAQFKPYHICPHRFSGVFGWGLSTKALNDVGVKFLPGMPSDEWVIHFPLEGSGNPELDFLRDDSYGKTFFCRWITPGMIGCTLSHLSVLQDAYDAGYQTIWVLEDDIFVQQDPHLLTSVIDKLDALVGKDRWDILYTDTDKGDKSLYSPGTDFEADLIDNLLFFNRPDIDLSDRHRFIKRTIVSDDFLKIGSRLRSHSMIIRRSGMKKILDFMKKHQIFLQYDHELAIVPQIQLFSLRYDLVTHASTTSDTTTNNLADREAVWKKQKQIVLNEVPSLLGWRDPQKAEKIMEFIKEVRPTICVEIGAFGGAITYPIASTLSFLKQGLVYAIDAWDVSAAIEGLEDKTIIQWWKNINMDAIYQKFLKLLWSNNHCRSIRQRSQTAVSLFANNSIDVLFLDGNVSSNGSLVDAQLYLPKVKEGGFIWLNLADTSAKNQTVAFLMKNCHWIKEKSIGINCVLFQKLRNEKIHEHGYWIGTEILHDHLFDPRLALGLVDFFKKEAAKNVVDFGCGSGEYVKLLCHHQIPCEGYDGNPASPQISNGIVQVLDLSQSFNLNKQFDWVMSLEVGEHLPPQYEKTFIENLDRHNTQGIILSWAVKGQGGLGHFNEQDNSYIKEMMARYGYMNDLEAENNLRRVAQLPWFKNTLMVFRKRAQ